MIGSHAMRTAFSEYHYMAELEVFFRTPSRVRTSKPGHSKASRSNHAGTPCVRTSFLHRSSWRCRSEVGKCGLAEVASSARARCVCVSVCKRVR
eukprot:1520201-Amphidinium_carterae.1